ncbi:MAG: hypothetical protein ACJ8DY_01090 [Xanthobacteraceae bacterium]
METDLPDLPYKATKNHVPGFSRSMARRRTMPAAPQAALLRAINTKGGRLRPVVRTTGEALRVIDKELPIELRRLPRWTFARELLEVAARTTKKRDIEIAARQFRQALSNEGWLADETAEAIGHADRS